MVIANQLIGQDLDHNDHQFLFSPMALSVVVERSVALKASEPMTGCNKTCNSCDKARFSDFSSWDRIGPLPISKQLQFIF